MDYYKCEICGCKISELDMNYKASQEDKRIICNDCRENNDSCYKDEVGGIHDSGTGLNPQGVYCGECAEATCKGCVNEHKTEFEE